MIQSKLPWMCSGLALLVALTSSAQPKTWKLIWSDEFDGPAKSTPDPKKWGFSIGGGGWGNRELETYTSRRENSFLDGKGNLVIEARRERFTGPDGITRDYTSARLNTADTFTQLYGRFEARMQLPIGQGLWPAFWTLGDNITSMGWPTCGEMDIMENIGREPSTNHGSLHGPGYSGGSAVTGTYTLPDGQRFADDFHVFAIEWSPKQVDFFVDDVLYQTKTPADLPAGRRWVFDHPFYIIMNVAVGGTFPGSPDETTEFPQLLIVDYVRVYGSPPAKKLMNGRMY